MLIIQRPTVEAVDEEQNNRQRFAIGPLDQIIKLRLLSKEDRPLAREVLLRELSPLPAAAGKALFDLAFDPQEPAVGMPQKDETHHR